MGKPSYGRHRRVASLLRRHLSEWLRREDIGLVLTISRVEVSEGLHIARVYIAGCGDETERGNVLNRLEESVPDLRRRLSRQLALRGVPRLQFLYDSELDDARRVQRLLSRMNA